MRWTLLITAALAASALAASPESSHEATDAEADAIYLTILNSSPVNEAMEMLTDVGIDKARARSLLIYLDEHLHDQRQQNLADAVGLCRNIDGRFSTPRALAHELARQQQAQREFEAVLVRHAMEILGVSSLAPVRGPHMKSGRLYEQNVVDLVADGTIAPADAIARACGATKEERAGFVERSETL